jgi:hypothetical protein
MTLTLSGNTSTGNIIGTLSYQWKDSIGNILGTALTQVVTSADTYSLTVTDSYNNNSNTEEITITRNTTKPYINIIPSDTEFRTPIQIITLDASNSYGLGSLNFSWSTNDGTITSATNINTITISSGGTYTLIVTDTANSSTETSSITILNYVYTPNPEAIISGNTNINCTTPSSTLDGSQSYGQGTLSYLWSTNETTSTIIVTSADTYTLVVTDSANGLTGSANKVVTSNFTAPTLVTPTASPSVTQAQAGQEITVSMVGGYTYQWSTTNGVIKPSSSLTAQSIIVTSTGIYTVVYKNPSSGCQQTSSVEIFLTSNPLAVNVTNNNGTSLNCSVGNTTLTSNVTNTVGVINYQWSPYGQTTQNITVTIGGVYYVTITDSANGSQATSNSTSVSADYTPPVVNIAANGYLPCVGTMQLDGSGSTGVGTLLYSWSGPGIVSGGNTSIVTINQPGFYDLRVYTNANASCSTTKTIVIERAINPTVTIPAPLTNVPPLTLTSNVVDGTAPFTYLWDSIPNELITSSVTGSTITVTQSGRYLVTVTDINGCTATASRLVSVSAGDTQAPTAPQYLDVIPGAPSAPYKLILSWDASTDNVGVIGYEISRSLNGNGTGYTVRTNVGGGTTTYQDVVNANTTYYYKVRAIDAANNFSQYSNEVFNSVITCFVEGTMISLSEDISVPIESLVIGNSILSSKIITLEDTNNIDELYTWNNSTLIESRVMSQIKSIHAFEANETIIINNGLLEATPEHSQLIYRNDEWKFIEIKNVSVGDMLYSLTKEIISVTSVEINKEPRVAYKMTLNTPNHTFFANEILTHNVKQL